MATASVREHALLDNTAAAEYIGIKPQTLHLWRCQGRGPAFHKVGGTRIRYRLRDLEAFLEKSRHAK
jgi:hypothetical protein